ncbi:MAG: hypothetical protein VX044_10155 [Planctomycetota bacterium]|nr:hypothetical protein [Planctomycetota bacterium]MEC8650998.1 hypothetical protein [Planctomycetota bacterium]
MMARAVGTEAAICERRACEPRVVYAAHLDEPRALMIDGAGTR